MTDVDIPRSFLDLFKHGAKWVETDGTLTREARKYLENNFTFDTQIRDRTGGSEDIV